mgnify:CR=1 FL=1
MLYYYLGVVACDVFNLVSAEYIIFSILLYVHDIVVLVEKQTKRRVEGPLTSSVHGKRRISSKRTTIDIFLLPLLVHII